MKICVNVLAHFSIIFRQQFIKHIKMTVKSINIKNHIYYFFNDMIFNDKDIGIYYIGYITIKKLMIIQIFIV